MITKCPPPKIKWISDPTYNSQSSSIFIHLHPSSSILIHLHPSSSIFIRLHPSSYSIFSIFSNTFLHIYIYIYIYHVTICSPWPTTTRHPRPSVSRFVSTSSTSSGALLVRDGTLGPLPAVLLSQGQQVVQGERLGPLDGQIHLAG